MYKLYLTCPRGLEQVLFNETSNYINQKIKIDSGGITLHGTLEDIYRINYKSRVAMNLHVELFSCKVNNYNELYKKVLDYNWTNILNHNHSFIIKTKINSKIFDNQIFCTMKCKDAIVDNIRKKTNNRPSIDKRKPDFYIYLFIKDKTLKIFLNSSGWPLFMRGYRSKIHKAALNESLAAGILQLTNWNKQDPIYDPFCGSGTFLIEAMMSTLNIPPRILRDFYSFMNWKNYDSNLWLKVLNEENSKIKNNPIKLYGSDIINQNINLAKKSLEKLDLKNKISFHTKNFIDIKPKEDKGLFLCNPPYGVRIGEIEKLKNLYRQIGDHLKNHFQGFESYIFTGNLQLLKSIGLRTKRKFILKNGMIDCRLAYYPLKKGKY